MSLRCTEYASVCRLYLPVHLTKERIALKAKRKLNVKVVRVKCSLTRERASRSEGQSSRSQGQYVVSMLYVIH